MSLKNKLLFFVFLFYGFFTIGECYSQETLSLDSYLLQVSKSNQEIKSAELAIQSAEHRVHELDMAYSSFLNGGVNYLHDASGPGFSSTLLTKDMRVTSWNLGYNKRFLTGSSVSLGYTDSMAKISLLEPTNLLGPDPITEFNGYDMKPTVTVEQSLLKDFRARMTQSGIKKTKSLIRAGQYMQVLKKQQAILKARSAYYGLSLARDVVYFRKTSLDRSEKILKWNENRFNLDLTDKTDLLQAQAAYKMRQLSMKIAYQDEEKARRDFNEMRGISSETVMEEVQKLTDLSSFFSNTGKFAHSGERADVLAAKELFESSKYASTEAYYRSGPELSIFGTASLHGLGLKYSDTVDQVLDADKPSYMVGLNFVTSLDFKNISKTRKGYELDVNSGNETLIKTELTANNDWEKLVKSWDDVMSRLADAVEISRIQTERANEEQKKFERGRTTTFQLLFAQNDLDDATLGVNGLIFEQLMIHAQKDLYDTKPFLW